MNCQECNAFSYFSLEDGICGKCHAKTAKLDRLKALYADRTDPDFSWFVILCIWRHGLSVSQTAQVLECAEQEVRAEIDIVKQDAR